MKILQLAIFLIIMGCTSNSPGQSVYTTKTGKKYHTATCQHLKYSKKEITFQQAIDLGYKPCSICRPNSDREDKENVNSFYSTQESSTPSEQTTNKVSTTQCTGKTKSGKRCKRRTTKANGTCYQH